jgi:hypothetical protein
MMALEVVMPTYAYRHPELERAWHTQAKDLEVARKNFEDAWALRVAEGLLEAVDGSFFDGKVRLWPVYKPDDLCPNDLGGHMMVEDTRPERRQFTTRVGTPVTCMLCKGTGWTKGGVSL